MVGRKVYYDETKLLGTGCQTVADFNRGSVEVVVDELGEDQEENTGLPRLNPRSSSRPLLGLRAFTGVRRNHPEKICGRTQ
jgi:hypothetical protein